PAFWATPTLFRESVTPDSSLSTATKLSSPCSTKLSPAHRSKSATIRKTRISLTSWTRVILASKHSRPHRIPCGSAKPLPSTYKTSFVVPQQTPILPAFNRTIPEPRLCVSLFLFSSLPSYSPGLAYPLVASHPTLCRILPQPDTQLRRLSHMMLDWDDYLKHVSAQL